MKNSVRYIFNWSKDSSSHTSSLIVQAINKAKDEVGYTWHSYVSWHGNHGIVVKFPICRPDDVARIAAFDALVNEFSKQFEDNGFEWEEKLIRFRQPRVLKNTAGAFFASSDVVAKVTRQRVQKVAMAYFNQSAGVRFTIDVKDWVIMGEGCHVHKMASLVREHFRKKDVKTTTAIQDFVKRYSATLHNDQVIIYGIDDQGNMVPVLTPRDKFELNIEQLNEWLQTRNYLPMGQVEFN